MAFTVTRNAHRQRSRWLPHARTPFIASGLRRWITAGVLVAALLSGGCRRPVSLPPPPPPPPPANRPPTVELACTPCRADVGQAVQLVATASDPDGDAVTYVWSLPPGAFVEAKDSQATWGADRPGHFAVSVTVADSRGLQDSATVTVEIVNLPLTAGPDDPPPVAGFPWPPPQWTTRQILPDPLAWRAEDRDYQTAFARVRAAVQDAGYPEWSVYPLPEGFALVAQMETIQEDGTPMAPPKRWLEDPPLDLSDWSAILRRLATADRGRYRIIVLLLTTLEVRASPNVNASAVAPLARSGPQTLPDETAKAQPPRNPTLTALVYEFRKKAGGRPYWLDYGSSGIDARSHLVAAKLWPGGGR